jgi:hypothetical protein
MFKSLGIVFLTALIIFAFTSCDPGNSEPTFTIWTDTITLAEYNDGDIEGLFLAAGLSSSHPLDDNRYYRVVGGSPTMYDDILSNLTAPTERKWTADEEKAHLEYLLIQDVDIKTFQNATRGVIFSRKGSNIEVVLK